MRLKKVFRYPSISRFISWILAQYIGLVFRTTRWKKIGEESFKEYARRKPFIACFWHNRLLMMTFAWPYKPQQFHMLISGHPDGQLIAQGIGHYGIQTIEGSKSKGGSEALRKILKVLQEGNVVGLTPDGPRGPRFKASEGIIQIARLAGVEIIPTSYSTSRRIVLKSWDRFILALPFGHGVFIWGKPIRVPRGLDKDQIEQYRRLIEKKLKQVSDEADQLCGQEPLE